MFRRWKVPERLPGYLRHPHAAVAALAVSVALVGAPAMRWIAPQREQPAGASGAQAALTAAAPPSAETTSAAGAFTAQPAPRRATGATELVAFYANFDEAGLDSLERNAETIDVLMPMWFHLGSDGRLTFDDSHAARVKEIIAARNPSMKVMPIVNNYDKASEAWNAPQVGALIADPAQRVAIAEHIVSTLASAGYDGVNIDFESFTEADRGNLVAFMAELYPRATAAGLEVSMDVIVGSRAYDHAALARHVDYLVPMMYDEHWKTSPAGAISSIPWFERTLAGFLEKVPADKVMVGIGTYAYDWAGSGGRAKSLTYDRAVALAQQRGATIGLTDPELNSAFTYTEGTDTHAVWMLDSLSAFNQLSIASRYRVRGYAVWRLGAEDPTLWNVLQKRDALGRAVAESLATPTRSIAYDDGRKMITGGVTAY